MRPTLLLLPALLACTAKAPPTPPETLDDRMMLHFGHATRAHDAVAAGDLSAARAAGAALAGLEPLPDTPEFWRVGLTEVRAEAGAISAAPSLPEAARAVARTGLACSNCHTRTGLGPKQPQDAPADPTNAPAEAMPRHEWATMWMWFGVISADGKAFDAGLSALVDAAVLDPRQHDDTFGGLQQRIRDLAAPPARTAADRAALYGEVLANCSACHDRYRQAH